MALKTKAHHWPSRLAAGAFILNSGLSNRASDDQAAEHLHELATGTYPPLKRLDPRAFTRLLSWGEITLGAALLLPLVPTGLAGLGLTAFATGLLGLYLRTPGTRRQGSLRPTEQGLSLATNTWLLGIGVGFVVEELTERLSDHTRTEERQQPCP